MAKTAVARSARPASQPTASAESVAEHVPFHVQVCRAACDPHLSKGDNPREKLVNRAMIPTRIREIVKRLDPSSNFPDVLSQMVRMNRIYVNGRNEIFFTPSTIDEAYKDYRPDARKRIRPTHPAPAGVQ